MTGSTPRIWLLVMCFVGGVVGTVGIVALVRGEHSAESRAALDGIVVAHVHDLLSNRFDLAWERVHPADRNTVDRALWESCKRSPDDELSAVRYRGVRIVSAREINFSSPLHDSVTAVAVKVEVRAAVRGVTFVTTDTSHWLLDGGRWLRMIEGPKLDSYAAGQCP